MNIVPFDRYTDKNGREYQVITTAVSLTTEKTEVVVQQLYGGYINISIPEEKFSKIFRKAGDEEKKIVPEKKTETAARTAKVPEPVPAQAAAHEVPEPADDEQDPAVRDMLAFLDSEDFDEKYMIVEHMAQNDELNDTFVDNMAASVDLVIDDGPLDGRIRELLRCLSTRKRYENTRLRN